MKTLTLDAIEVGHVFSFSKTITETDELHFAEVSSDASTVTIEGRRLVHGMLAASFFSALLDEHCPGPECFYVQQTLQFRKPLFISDTVEVRGTILSKSESTRMITIRTEILRGAECMISGEAIVQLMQQVQ